MTERDAKAYMWPDGYYRTTPPNSSDDGFNERVQGLVRENTRLREVIQIAILDITEACHDIDVSIDNDYPPDTHPTYADKNAWRKENNPARAALRTLQAALQEQKP